MKASWKSDGLAIGVIVLSFVAGLIAYPRLPNPVPTHWNAAGQPNGYSSPLVGAFLFPLIMLGIYMMFIVLPKIDPRGRNYERFGETYVFLRNLIVLYLAFVDGMSLFAIFQPGHTLNSAWMMVGIGFLFAAMGNYMPRVRPNWFVGIRTPWTLSSDEVWRATHRLGGQVMFVGGIAIVVVGILLPSLGLATVMAAAAALALIPTVYSYLLYRRLPHGGSGPRAGSAPDR